MFYYFLTIDKSSTNDNIQPTRKMYMNILMDIMDKGVLSFTSSKYPLYAYEYKDKVINKLKVNNWLHLHAMLKCNKLVDYKKYNKKGFSIVWRKCNTFDDVAVYSAYCAKDKIDKSMVVENYNLKSKQEYRNEENLLKKYHNKSILDYYK